MGFILIIGFDDDEEESYACSACDGEVIYFEDYWICYKCGKIYKIYTREASQAASLLGSRTSKAKKKSSVINGKLGGRPKKASQKP